MSRAKHPAEKITCINSACPDFERAENIVAFGRDKNGKQRYRCKTCRKVFVETRNTFLYHRKLSVEQLLLICRLLAEGKGVRAVARLLNLNRNTVVKVVRDLVADERRAKQFLEEAGSFEPRLMMAMWEGIRRFKRGISDSVRHNLGRRAAALIMLLSIYLAGASWGQSVPYITVTFDGVNVTQGDVIAADPSIEANISDQEKIDSGSIRLMIDRQTVTTVEVIPVSPFVYYLRYRLEPPLTEGSHKIKIEATNILGNTMIWERIGLRVFGGEARIFGQPITEPQPFNVLADKNVYVTYTLSQRANIQLFIYDATGGLVWRKEYSSPQDGGRAGLNRISWNGVGDDGEIVGEGIYPYRLIAVSQGKKRAIGKGRMVVVYQ